MLVSLVRLILLLIGFDREWMSVTDRKPFVFQDGFFFCFLEKAIKHSNSNGTTICSF